MQSAPLDDYRVELDDYSGPLDLLLFLVKKNEVDLHDIPVALLTEQYLQHLREIEKFDINLASEFLVMAATLLEIKSQLIAPKAPTTNENGEEIEATDALNPIDPRFELVQQLLAYKRIKDAANELRDRQETWEARYAHRPARSAKPQAAQEDEDADAAPVEIDIEDVSITDLCEAFARILESIGQTRADHEVFYDDTPISLHAEDIYDRLKREGPMTLQAVFVGRARKSELIGLFLATLELVKEKRIKVVQNRIAGEISLEVRPKDEQHSSADDKAVDWRDPETGEVQYEWPSEKARERAAKRASRRIARAMGKHKGEDDGEDAYIEIKRETLDDMLQKQGQGERAKGQGEERSGDEQGSAGAEAEAVPSPVEQEPPPPESPT
ncbi:MAG: segregation/condensation protein A [Phycisphaeraceae bacterium]